MIHHAHRSLTARRTLRLASLLVGVVLTGAGLVALPGSTPAARASTPQLPFDLPSTSALRSTGKLVFAHYFPPLPLSIDNESSSSDYYARNYLTPSGEKGKHAAYGGYLRDRPVPRSVSSTSDWRLRDMETEVREAISAGIDGFTLDLLALPGDSNDQLVENAELMLQAASAVDPGFKIMLMPDMTGSQADKSAADLARGVAALAKYSSAYRLSDGRLMVSPVMAESHSADWWSSFLSTLDNTYDTRAALLPVFIGNEQSYAPSFASISYGMSIWGSRNPDYNDPTVSYSTSARGRAAKVKALGVKWMQPVSVQDERPNQGIFDEAENTTNLRDTWELARDTDADFVQIPTWNDYAEGTQLAPSVKHGWSYLDITSYYLTWWKTGRAPAITRDAAYLTHRTQKASAQPSYDQSLLMRPRGGSPARDTVEALTFLTAPARVVVNVGAHNYVCAAQAGVDTCTVPLGYGPISVWVERDGDKVEGVRTPYEVTSTPYVQDLQYIAASSLRTPSGGGNGVAATELDRIDRTVATVPTADTYANRGAPGTNYGSTSSLSSRGDTAAESFLRFSVPPVPAGMRLVSAALSIHAADDSSSGSSDTQTVYSASDSWDEDDLDWDDRPSRGSSLGSLSTDTSPGHTYTVPLSLPVLASYAGSQRTLEVASSGSNELRFWSRDYEDITERPALVLTYTPVF